MDPATSAMHAAQAAQSATLETRELLRDIEQMFERFVQAPDETGYNLTATTAPAIDEISISDRDRGLPCLSTGIINFDAAVALNVGYGGRSPRANAGAIIVPARRVIVVPWIVGRVELDVEPGQAYPAGGLACAVVRFPTVQPFSFTQI